MIVRKWTLNCNDLNNSKHEIHVINYSWLWYFIACHQMKQHRVQSKKTVLRTTYGYVIMWWHHLINRIKYIYIYILFIEKYFALQIPGGVASDEEFDSAESQQDHPLIQSLAATEIAEEAYPNRFCGRYVCKK